MFAQIFCGDNMVEKAFFSSAIIIFAIFILMFFITLREESKPLTFDDSPRLLALKAEEAYAIIDKNLSYVYLDYKKGKDCNTLQQDADQFKQYVNTNYTSVSINEICRAAKREVKSSFSNPNTLDLNVNIILTCRLFKYQADINSELNYTQQFYFNKRYQSYSTLEGCKYILTDMDADKVYADITIPILNLYH